MGYLESWELINQFHRTNWRWQSPCWYDWIQVGELQGRLVVLWVAEVPHSCQELD